MFRDTDNDAGDPANEGVWASSVADCAAVCVASANCSYASYQSSVGTCWLKGNGAGRQHSAGIAFLDCSKAKPRPASKSVLMVGQQSADGFLLLGNYVDEGRWSCFLDLSLPVSLTRKASLLHAALNADIDSFGPSAGTVSILSGMQGQLGAGAVRFVQGCASPACPQTGADFAPAVAAASEPSVSAVVVTIGLGDTEGFDCATVGCESEAHDRVGIELPGNQLEQVVALKRAVEPSGKPLICVVISGGTLALGPANVACDAIVAGWYPGMRGGERSTHARKATYSEGCSQTERSWTTGTAIAEVLTGAANPAGRTPATWYSSTAVLPPMGVVSPYPDPAVGYSGLTYRYFENDSGVDYQFGKLYDAFWICRAVRLANPKGITMQKVSGCRTRLSPTDRCPCRALRRPATTSQRPSL